MKGETENKNSQRYVDILSNAGFKAFFGHSKDFKFDRYISEYTFREKECHDLLDETIVIIFAELTRFHKAEDECVTLQDRLLYLLKNSGKMRTPPKWGTEKPCKDLLNAFEIEDFSKQKREQYDKDMYDEKRRNGELAAGMSVEQIVQFTGLDFDAVMNLQ